jgi:hypothetical protein
VILRLWQRLRRLGRREWSPDEIGAREQERQAADDVATTRTAARSPLRDFTNDRGPRR